MNVTIMTREGFTVLGVQNRINPMTADYKAIWEGQVRPHFDDIQAFAVEEGCFSVYYPTDEPQMADMLAGMAVAAGTAAPEGLIVRDVPAGEYAVAECSMDAIGATWGYLYEQWQQTADYTIDDAQPSFEYYPPNVYSGEGLVSIWVPVIAK